MKHINGFVCSMLWAWFQWIQWFHEVSSSNIHVNRSSAQQQCEQYGGLLSYETVFKGNTSSSLNKNYQHIKDGDSAWVSGFVKYLKFVSWHGCYFKYAVNGKINFKMSGKSVFSCFNLCSKTQNFLYIGISSDRRNRYRCYCIVKDILDENLAEVTSNVSKHFNREYPGDLFYGSMMFGICHNKTDPSAKLDVYKLHDINRKSFIKYYGQCIYAKIVPNFTVKYGAGSCFSYGKESKNGYICVGTGMNIMWAYCNNYSSIYTRNNVYCIIHATSDWYQAQLHCISMYGRLVDVIPIELALRMQTNVTYWTGLFREFKILPSVFEIPEGDVCLSVKKTKTEFVLEPDQCFELKLKLCQNENNSSEFLNDDFSVTFAHPTVLTVNNNSYNRSSSNNTYSNRMFATKLRISLTFNGVLLLIIICLAIVLYRRRREPTPSLYRLTCEKGTTTRSNDTLADDSVFNAIASNEYHDDSQYYTCPDSTATGTGRRENKYDLSHDSGAKQYDHICLRNASHQHVGRSENINVSDYSHINAKHGGYGGNINVSDYSHTNALAKVTASNQTMYEEIKVQILDRKTETEL